MSNPFVGEIRMFAGSFAPRTWALCDGQLIAVSQNDALFSLLGTIYGGDGRTTFGLPDLRGRVPIHAGTGPGLSPRRLGLSGGSESVTLVTTHLPSHGHAIQASTDIATESSPRGNVLAQSSLARMYVESDPAADLASSSVTSVGGSRNHTNLMPTQCIHFIIALYGVYPSRH